MAPRLSCDVVGAAEMATLRPEALNSELSLKGTKRDDDLNPEEPLNKK
jgi:hypothetical protein